MARILIVYESKYGQSSKIARFINHELSNLGHRAEVNDVNEMPRFFAPLIYDGIVVVAPVYQSGYPRKTCRWVRRNSGLMNLRPGLFVSVCLGVLETRNERTQAAERRLMTEFLKRTGWQPLQQRMVAGALNYTRYGWLLRKIMKRIAQKAGGAIDTTQDHEYTDWIELRRFAKEFTAILSQNKAQIEGVSPLPIWREAI